MSFLFLIKYNYTKLIEEIYISNNKNNAHNLAKHINKFYDPTVWNKYNEKDNNRYPVKNQIIHE